VRVLQNNTDKVLIARVEKRDNINYIPPKQSANSLFRFFDKPQYLFQALKKTALFPRYYPENVDYLKIEFKQIAYPMICFCDINIHRLGEHLDLYGKYGIAFSKTWGIGEGIQPLQYINHNSVLRKDFSSAFESAMKSEGDDLLSNYLLTQMYYMKPIVGTMPRNSEDISRNFTDEKEWRYIPDVTTIDLPQVITEDSIASIGVLNETISNYDSCWLKFEAGNVKYIILQDSEELDELCSVLDESIEDDNIKRKLISKVIIWDEAKEDF
jgi:hypothetical protein